MRSTLKQGENKTMSHQQATLLNTGISTRVTHRADLKSNSGLLTDGAFQAILSLVICLNLLDAVLTLSEIHFGIATEANPLMKALIDYNPALFILGKTALVGFCLGILYMLRKHRQAHLGLRAVGIIYSALIGWHVIGLNLHFLGS